MPCSYCGTPFRVIRPHGMLTAEARRALRRPQPTRDHVLPRSRFSTRPQADLGVVDACRGCNEDKGNRTIPEWLEELRAERDPRAAHVTLFHVRWVERFYRLYTGHYLGKFERRLKRDLPFPHKADGTPVRIPEARRKQAQEPDPGGRVRRPG